MSTETVILCEGSESECVEFHGAKTIMYADAIDIDAEVKIELSTRDDRCVIYLDQDNIRTLIAHLQKQLR